MGFSAVPAMPQQLERRDGASSNSHHSISLKTVGITLSVIGWILSIVTCFLPMWVVTTSTGSPTTYEGLWMSCAMQSSGQLKCQFNMSLASGLRNIQTLTIISICMPLEILINLIRRSKGFIYITMCIKIKASPANFMIMSGFYCIMGGIFLAIPVSEIAYIIYNLKQKETPHVDLGASLYVGFAASALYIIGGVLLCCTHRGSKSPQNWPPPSAAAAEMSTF